MQFEPGNLPPDFVSRIQRQFPDESDKFLQAIGLTPEVSLRLNPVMQNLLNTSDLDPIPWEPLGFYLRNKAQFGTDPLFQAGGYYVQEASSMACGWIFKNIREKLPQKSLKVLDACASPGGKSTHLLSLLNPEDVLIANEAIRSRYPVLVENLVKWGYINQIITQEDPAEFRNLPHFFDCIICDAPCSGEGMFRKDPDARAEWTPANVAICAARQKRILEDLLPSLKPGGIIIYSTCTYAPEENEFQMQYLQNEGLICITPEYPPLEGWHKVQTDKNTFGWQALPHKVRGEGYFICAFIKPQADVTEEFNIEELSPKKSKLKTPALQIPFDLNNTGEFVTGRDGSLFIQSRNTMMAGGIMQMVGLSFRGGLKAGAWKANKFLPDAELALWKNFPKGIYPEIELDRTDAIKYLQKEIIPTHEYPVALHRVTYKSLGLGWLNVLQNRANNQYPIAWRLRSASEPALDPFP